MPGRDPHHEKSQSSSPRVMTIGHSTRSLDEFKSILRAHQVVELVDVRTIPRSKRNPQFNKEALERALRSSGIGYTHMKGLGGLRHPKDDSVNKAWRNLSFRGYADHMQTIDFEADLAELETLVDKTKTGRVAFMCAESLPWRCHRSLIADALTVRGFKVEHIMSESKTQEHRLTPFAVIRGTQITYPEESAR